MNKFTKWLYRVFYSLPFGIKAADKELVGGAGNELGDGTEITKEVSDERVAKHLLKGEVTQEVEDLRYRTYLVDKESDKYKYVANGIAEKMVDTVSGGSQKGKYHFTQENRMLCSSVLEGMNDFEKSTDIGKRLLEISYRGFSRFRIENLALSIEVKTNGDECQSTFAFNTVGNVPKERSFVRELSKMSDGSGYRNAEIEDTMFLVMFSTFRASRRRQLCWLDS